MIIDGVPRRYFGSLSSSQSKSQEHGPELSLLSESCGESGGSRLQLSPSHKPNDVGQVTKPQFLHLRTRSVTTHPHILRNQTTNPLSKCQLPSPLLLNHKRSYALDSGRKVPK